jgi:hypothetical protein
MRLLEIVMELALIISLQFICVVLMGMAPDYFVLWLLCWVALAMIFWHQFYKYWRFRP